MTEKPHSVPLIPAFFLLIPFLFWSSCAFAVPDTPQLKLDIVSNQSHFSENETAWLTLTIENASDTDCYDVDVRHLLPKGLDYADGHGLIYFPVIPANTKQTCTVGIKKSSSDLTISVKSDKKAYQLGEIATLTLTMKNNTLQPLYNVELYQFLPDGLVNESNSSDSYFFIDTLQPLEVLTRTYLVRSIWPEVLVSIESDKSSYTPGETACLTLSVRNRSNENLTDVHVEHFLPDGMIYDLEHNDASFQFLSVAPGETVECQVYVRYVDANLPETGDFSGIWFVLLTVSVLLLGLVQFVQPFKGGKFYD